MTIPATPVRRAVTRTNVLAVDTEGARERPDGLVTEEPMEIRVHGPGEEPVPLAVTMRTPGNDFELAAGFLLTEGVISGPDELDTIAYCLGGDGEQQYNVVTVRLRRRVALEVTARRFLSNSSCGICGKAALDELAVRCDPVGPGPTIAASVVRSLPATLAEHQRVFDETGGLHAAARFDAGGTLLAAREDVGRHNALDKLVGHALLERALPLADQVLLVSGRLSFELVQKAAVAGLPVLCAVSAPSSLAVNAAREFGQTVIGFLRDDRFNVYTHPERLDATGERSVGPVIASEASRAIEGRRPEPHE
ncbi:MAG: formate dehydrogenase accessory sulfurtransferase FdhD [Actinomycetota bacterium]|nr:formate dehydrogenase accessory sulfurtransferase FdhD [Actinomycetota bacterium]